MKMNMKKRNISNYIPHGKSIICMKFCIDLLSCSGEEVYIFIFNPIWPTDHVTEDIVNLIRYSHRVEDQVYEVSDFSDKDFDSTNYGWNTTSLMMSSISPKNTMGSWWCMYAKFIFFHWVSEWENSPFRLVLHINLYAYFEPTCNTRKHLKMPVVGLMVRVVGLGS